MRNWTDNGLYYMIVGRAGCGLGYAVKKSGGAVAYCALGIRCGTRNEDGFHSGIAHFVEHTLFKGTEHRRASSINSYLDRLGGELNAYTTKEEIVIHATVLKEDLPKAVSLLFELATSATFPEKEVEKEKGVVIDEINSYKDSPSEEIYDRFEELLFHGHPLSRPILGTAASVRKITGGELHSFIREKFIPEDMVFSVVADIPEERMERQVERLCDKFFAGMAARSAPSSPARQPVRIDNVFDRTVNKRNHQVNCIIGSPAPSLYQTDERVPAALLCNILGGPASNSILNSVLREKYGWVYGVECSYTQYADTGIAAVSFGCERDNYEKCLVHIGKEVGKLQDTPLGPNRLKAAKKQVLGQLAIVSDNGESQCLSMCKSLLAYGTVMSDQQTREMVEAVTAADILESARRIFGPSSSRLIFL